jgi:hypothetical protein
MDDEKVATEITALKERVKTMEARQEKLDNKLSWFQGTLFLTLGGVIANLAVLLSK